MSKNYPPYWKVKESDKYLEPWLHRSLNAGKGEGTSGENQEIVYKIGGNDPQSPFPNKTPGTAYGACPGFETFTRDEKFLIHLIITVILELFTRDEVSHRHLPG